MAKLFGDLETWLLDEGDRLYRYLVYKKKFTPYEEQNAFTDQSVYESIYYSLCKIEEAIDLGDDWLLGLRDINDDGEICDVIHFYKFSEIRLSLFEKDQHLELYKDDKEEADE